MTPSSCGSGQRHLNDARRLHEAEAGSHRGFNGHPVAGEVDAVVCLDGGIVAHDQPDALGGFLPTIRADRAAEGVALDRSVLAEDGGLDGN